MKNKLALFVAGCISINLLSTTVVVNAAEVQNAIDLYQIFSNKQDQMKRQVGSRVFKWSMHLPDDAVIYKSDRANFFNMNTESYKSNVSLEVNKNKNNSTLEEIFYAMQYGGGQNYGFYFGFGEKEFISTIEKDKIGKSFIRVVKMDQIYDYFLMDDAAEKIGSYIENRIYIENNNIYNLQVVMDGKFYKDHPEMFDKLVSSFTLQFDDKNPYIKELSDSVSEVREYENKSYGWKMKMYPYWKIEGVPNARTQNFRALYSDEELYGEKNKEPKPEDEMYMSPEGVTVTLVSSAEPKETVEGWAQGELQQLKKNYNPEVYKVLINQAGKIENMQIYILGVRYETLPKKPYVAESMYVIGNGYKYRITANIPEEKYKEPKSRQIFEEMMKSFRLTGTHSKYLGKITDVSRLIDLTQQKEIKTKTYSFKTKVTKDWSILDSNKYMYEMMYLKGMEYYRPYFQQVSNQESIMAVKPESGMQLTMTAGFNTQDFKNLAGERARAMLNNDEVRSKLAKVTVESAKVGNVEVYRFIRLYDMNGIKKFIKEDTTKSYDYKALVNEYTYMFKVNNDVYTQILTIPLANMTQENRKIAEDAWKNTEAANVNYSQKITKWTQHSNDEYNDNKK